LDFVPSFDWDDANRAHIARHRVTTEEAEQVIRNEPLDMASEVRDGEDRVTSLGRTNRGRFLVVVSTLRGARLRVVTAFPSPAGLIQVYFAQEGDD
jgi:uncharacterized DUF497 family protein